MAKHLLTWLALGAFTVLSGHPEPGPSPDLAAMEWVDAIYNDMSPDERIGQLIWLRAHSDKGPDHVAFVEKMIREYHVGGLTFFQGTPLEQAKLTNQYQALTKRVPLIISMDAEWGLGMRMKQTTISYPRQLMLGAIQDNLLIYDMGAEIARQLRRLGVHVNFAPVADVNNNPANPVINYRSFGEDRYNVAVKSFFYMKGMQDHQVMACAKHFPGHGDTDTDSHLDLPVIAHDRSRLDSIELFPFRVLSEQGIGSMMVAHLSVPALDSTPNFPTTLSFPTVGQLLKQDIGYEGLVVTDGLDMQGVTKYHKSGEVEAKALAAGNDILLIPPDIPAAVARIKEYLGAGKIDSLQFERSVKKVLLAKYRLGLTEFNPIPLGNLEKDLNDPKGLAVKRKLTQHALTLLRNDNNWLPIDRIDTLEIASLSIGSAGVSPFQSSLSRFAPVEHFQAPKEMSESQQQRLLQILSKKELVIASLHDMSQWAGKNFGVSASSIAFLKKLQQRTQVVWVVFGNPYALTNCTQARSLLLAYDEDPVTQDLAAQGIFGAYGFRGKLPVTASPEFRYGDGIFTPSLHRLGYGLPEETGLNSAYLPVIDSIMTKAIDKKATPGGVVLVAKNGRIVMEKAYGKHTYKEDRPVRTDDIYDLASVTKIAAATLAMMKLHDEGKLSIYDTLGAYLPELQGTDKAALTIEEIMTHRSGLKAWIPFYKETITNRQKPMPEWYREKPDTAYNIPVATNLFLRYNYLDTIWQRIILSPLSPSKDYVYSDLGFILVARIVERVSGYPLDAFTDREFYRPMGLRSTGFNPWNRFEESRIPPTEEDDYFRQRRIQGYVHDMGAAMLGGISGHAGLFSSAGDLAAVLQMLLQKGYYGGKRYLRPETVDLFIQRCGVCSRRGIGFDLMQIDPGMGLNLSPKSSPSTFGHLGFTGIGAWADPEHQLIFILLSNRTYPSMDNNAFLRLDVRVKAQSAVYDALEYY
ncbi:MAG: glycoside hydrolase family 3 N-terminal domain-containing protein [Saprospiraceae bacterium]